MNKKSVRKGRQQIRTVLIVGEGSAEQRWLRYLKDIYHERNSGCSIKLGNAHGKGAAHVVDYAIRQQRQFAYDVVAAFFDTDTAWTPEVRARAETCGIVLFASEPCLEAEVLRLYGCAINGSTSDAKVRFRKEFCEDALNVNYVAYFPVELMNKRIESDPLFSRLVWLIKTGKCN